MLRDNRCGLLNATIDVWEVDSMFHLVVVDVDEDFVVRAILRMVLEELRDSELGVEFGASESGAVLPLPGLHRWIVEAGSVLEGGHVVRDSRRNRG